MSKQTLKSDEIAMLLSHLADIVELMNEEVEQMEVKLQTMQKRIEEIKNA